MPWTTRRFWGSIWKRKWWENCQKSNFRLVCLIPDYESEMERDSNVERVFMVYYEWGVLLQKKSKIKYDWVENVCRLICGIMFACEFKREKQQWKSSHGAE